MNFALYLMDHNALALSRMRDAYKIFYVSSVSNVGLMLVADLNEKSAFKLQGVWTMDITLKEEQCIASLFFYFL